MSDRILAGTVGVGALVATLAFLTPYLDIDGVVSAPTLRSPLLKSLWFLVLVAGSYKRHSGLVYLGGRNWE